MAEKLRNFGDAAAGQKSKRKHEDDEEEDLDNMLFTERRKEDQAKV